MTIQEKPRDLEFTYETEIGKAIYNIKFIENNGNVCISQSTNSDTFVIEANILAEIVDFLREKKVVGTPFSLPTKENTILGSAPVSKDILPIPTIEPKDGSSLNSVPFSSFNSEQDNIKETDRVKEKEIEVKEKKDKKEGIYVDGKKVDGSDIKLRPVIKAKTTTESDMLRSGVVDFEKHSIRSQHR